MVDCLFCKIVNKQLETKFVFEDDKVVAFKDIRPKADVHLLVVPKKHIKDLTQFKDEDSELVMHMVKLLPKLAEEFGLNTGFRTIINTGSGGGQEIFHVHFHLIGGSRLVGF